MPVTQKDLDALNGKIGKAELHLAAAKTFAGKLKAKLAAEKAKPTKAKK